MDETLGGVRAGLELPLVLVWRGAATHLASAVAPGYRDLGLMLPSSPLHHLLLDDTGLPLVMTSGNVSGEPIAILDDEALSRLAWIADLFLLHNRDIASRAEDSVVRVVTMPDGRQPLMIRHSRGFAPAPLPLPVPAHPPVVGLGGQQRNTFTLARGELAWVGQHIGDVDNVENLHTLREAIAHLGRLFNVTPGTIAHDAHPADLPVRRAAKGNAGSCLTPVPHHHAHFAACLGEHGEMGRAVGLVFDGRGHGDDGGVWGGEILLGDLAGVERVGHLWPVRMPGGDVAIHTPWRMACAWLTALSPGIPPMPPALEGFVNRRDWERASLLARDPAMPVTTSVGRLFDAISALCGVCPDADYEGQPAVELEMVADEHAQSGYALPLRRKGPLLVLDARRLVRAVRRDLRSGVPVPTIAARAHIGLAEAAARAAVQLARTHSVSAVALSGGVFQNVLLLERITALLAHEGLRWLVPRRLPPNDGGLSYGQAVVAATRSA
jgi:hydrogenase maturation protein HypF